MIGISLEGGSKVAPATEAFVSDTKVEAHDWLMNMGYAISGNTQWLNRRQTRGGLNIYPSVRKRPEGVLLQIKWRKAHRGTRRLVAKNMLTAKRAQWAWWTRQL